MNKTVTVIGAGLAGSEASYQLAKRGFKVKLYEMRPKKQTPAHKTGLFAELVCSNSLRAAGIENAVGLLKQEMRMLDSLIIKCADKTSVPAGGALAVDRDIFSQMITDEITNNPNIEVIEEEITSIPKGPVIIASGPLTSDSLSNEIKKLINEEYLYFFDAAAPIVEFDSIDMEKAYRKSRYDKGEADYINCPMTEEQYNNWYNELVNAKAVEMKEMGEKVILVRNETSPEDLIGMNASQGILTARGGMTSHAAVVARGMGKCCVAGCSSAKINEKEGTLKFGDKVSVKQAIEGSIVRSYNELTIMLAEKISGDEWQFARDMNLKAVELGMFSTSFRNASGLHNQGQFTDGEDLADSIALIIICGLIVAITLFL